MHKIKQGIKLQVLTDDKESPMVVCDTAISEYEDEVLLSDQLISALTIVIEDAGKGIWRFRDDPSSIARRSEKPEIW
jgi:hypothetical protein